jgi:peptidoglycan/LPS O-acetylase OafA/YrhL
MVNYKYRPDIDGLRAIAVSMVLLHHAGLSFSGGYVGVDVFFVISGFLITGILLREESKGTFSFKNFWMRRVRRILPAAIVMAGIVTI